MASSAPTTDLGLPENPSPREERSAALSELLSMYGMLHDLYEKAPGAEDWHRLERKRPRMSRVYLDTLPTK